MFSNVKLKNKKDTLFVFCHRAWGNDDNTEKADQDFHISNILVPVIVLRPVFKVLLGGLQHHGDVVQRVADERAGDCAGHNAQPHLQKSQCIK